MCIAVALGVSAAAALGGTAVGAMNASTESGLAGTQEGLAKNQAANQQWYNQQLQQLITNPSSFTSSPGFESTLAAAQKQQAAAGYLGSTNETGALQAQAFQQLLAQENTLAPLTGTGANPASALSGASSSLASGNQMLQGGLGQMGGLMGMLLFGSQNGWFGGGGGSGFGISGIDSSGLATLNNGYSVNLPGYP
jgi:hypothetical protein